ncbi:uncharacterized protein TRIADDRAFT_61852 [Trichoplax adhaerens]|uniref:G-protein coupled receptors family 2 profile 2 domain-containing protein n=1 Tax=Trichoplax adhaerens TaxID=10228 RepID=B3SC62_TRIAD|nr:hypothetical protein TRIADDRAFT_61852 [Trichoplax adhaerens]EDV19665.1 hypothetical protein TRIADDRAFT_61852 [Trichoplax adhaerens]|eukprot:XP_002117822.1 hypothetical protein TRIADDRAFT_61852 [Trichoplax adhaerens]
MPSLIDTNEISPFTVADSGGLSLSTAFEDARVSSPTTIEENRLSLSTVIENNRLLPSTVAENDRLSLDAAIIGNRLSASTSVINDRLSSNTGMEDDRLSLSTEVKNSRLSSDTATEDDRLFSSTVVKNDKLSSNITTEDDRLTSSTATEDDKLSSSAVIENTSLAASIAIKTDTFSAWSTDFSVSISDTQDTYQAYSTKSESLITGYTTTSDANETSSTNLRSSGNMFIFDYGTKTFSLRTEPNIYLTNDDNIESVFTFSIPDFNCYPLPTCYSSKFSSQSTVNNNQHIITNIDKLSSVSFKSLTASSATDVPTNQTFLHPTLAHQDTTLNPFDKYSEVPFVTADDTLRILANINEELAIHPYITVQTAEIYSQGLNQLISKLATNASNTELIIKLSQKIEISVNYTKVLDKFFLRVADNLFPGQTLNITDDEAGQTVKILTGIYSFLRDEITQAATTDNIISDVITCKIDPDPPADSGLNFRYSIIKSENIWHQLVNLNDLQSLLAPIIIIEYIGIGFSTICIALALIVFGVLRLKSDRFIIHRNLLVALFLLQCTIIAGSQSEGNKNLCTAMAILTHFFCVATFSWMLIEAIHLYFLIITVFKKSRISIYYFIGWGLPIITVAVTLTAKFDGYVNNNGVSSLNKCWLNTQDGFKWAIMGPVISIIVVNAVVMICVVKITVSSSIADAYKSDNRKGRLQGIKSMIKASAILTPILGLTWLLALIPITRQTIVFAYLSVILNSCQGITIFVFHCILNSEVRLKYTLLISRRSAIHSSNKASLFIDDKSNLKTGNSDQKDGDLKVVRITPPRCQTNCEEACINHVK